jgi:hypothetical protein
VLSCANSPGLWAIGFVNPFGQVLQALPTSKSLYQALIDGAADGSYLYPLGLAVNIDPREHMPIGADQRVHVSREDHEIYMKMDSSFEVCKICHSGRKNLRMEPCQHLIVCFCTHARACSSVASGLESWRYQPLTPAVAHLQCRKCYDSWNLQQRRENGATVSRLM